MADFTPEKLDLSKINNGKRFENGDGVSAEAVNAPIEAVAYLDEKMSLLSSATVVTVGGKPVETFDADTKLDIIPPDLFGLTVFGYQDRPRGFKLTHTPAIYSIPYRDENGKFLTGEVSDIDDPQTVVNKEYADTKVAAEAGSYSGYFMYGNYTRSDGTFYQNIVNARPVTGETNPKLSNVLPLYNGDGTLSGSYPKKPFNYTTKSYVDNSISNDCLPKQPKGYLTTYNADVEAFEILDLSIPSGGGYVALMISNNYYSPESVNVITDFKYIISDIGGLGNLVPTLPSGVYGYSVDRTPKKIEGFEILIQTNIGANESPQYDMVSNAYATIENYYDHTVGTYFRVYFYNADTNENITSKVAHAPIVLIK